MKRLFLNFILSIIFLIIILILILSTVGVETNKFNKFISEKAAQTKNVDLNLETIKFKIDIKKISLYLETQNSKINYRNISIPAKNIKVFIDFLSLAKSSPSIKNANIIFEELDITQLTKLSSIIKPSNLRSLINNKIKEGKLISEIDIFFNEDGSLKEFIVKGKIKKLKADLFSDLMVSKTNLDFFADKNDILIKNIYGNVADIKVSDGDIKINLEKGIKVNSNFNSKIVFDEKLFNKYEKFLKKYSLVNSIKSFKATFNNNLSLNLDETYKLKNYNYNISGKVNESKFELPSTFKNDFISEEIKEIYFSDIQMKTIFSPNKTKVIGDGNYSFNNKDFYSINLENEFIKNFINLKANFDFGNSLKIGLLNYEKSNNSIANISLDLKKTKDEIKIHKLNYSEQKNLIKIENLSIQNDILISFDNIRVLIENNDFTIKNNKKIFIKGNKFDATNLPKFFNTKNNKNILKKIDSNIEIDFKSIKIPFSEKLRDFKLIGEIKKGKFEKISSKGDFGGGNFLDITMKKDKNTDKKYLEIYSDLTKPLLTEYSFFKGLSGGKLFFTSIIDNLNSTSKLKIEKFKVVDAPGLIKLLSLADLRGLADLADGEGLSFDSLEIDMEKNKNFLKLNEILALGPSISVLMEGYQAEDGLISLKGTLVPAKTLNKMISKIPVIGNIVIPKEVGEGLFGISFKMKGPKGKVKTTINPIRTLTPRFIQKIIDKNKETK